MAELQRNFHILKGGYIGEPSINTAGAGPSSGQCSACPKAGTCSKLIEMLAKGEITMNTNRSTEELLPPGVEEGNDEITIYEALAGWDSEEGLEPAHITALRVGQISREKSGGEVEELLPPGVE